jgi:hypothetical protein
MSSNRDGVAPSFLVLFASLYGVQGVVIAYFFNFNKSYMQAFGLREDVVATVQSLALLPLVLKFLVGPLSDRFELLGRGRRLPYIVFGLASQATGLLGLATLDPSRQLASFAGMAILTVVGLAVYDTCCDGLVIDVTPPAARARVQGLLWTSRFVAATVVTLGFGLWLERLGGARHASALLLASAVVTLAPAALALVLRAPTEGAERERFRWSALSVMTRPWSLALLAFGMLYGLAGMAVESNLSLHYLKLGFMPGQDVGALGATRNFGRAVGAVVLPLAATMLSRRRVLETGVMVLALSVAAQSIIRDRIGAGLIGLVFGAAMGWNDTLFAALAMEAADPRLAASTFALFMAVTNSSVIGDAFFARGVVVSGGYAVPLLAAAVVALAALPLVGRLSRPASSDGAVTEEPGDGSCC